MHVHVIDCDQAAEWDRFLAEHPGGSFYHLHGWGHVNAREFGHDTTCLAAIRDGRIAGVLPLVLVNSRLFGRILCSMPFVNYGGVVASDAEAEVQLLAAARQAAADSRADYLELRSPRLLATDMQVSLRKISMTLRLDPDPEVLWSAFASKHRTNIRRVYKHGVTVAAGGAELLDEFYDVLVESWRRLGTPIYRKGYFRAILEQFPQQTRLFVCRHGTRPVAAAFNGEFNGVVEGMWLGYRAEARPLQAAYVLYWEMIKDACERGFSSYHLGRSTADSGGEDFKKKWNAESAQLYWYYHRPSGGPMPQLNVDNPKFRVAIAAWRRLPLSLTTRVGPLIARGIP
jgi:FemAB-related protein (PEP-CTERM system-associated)